MAIGLVDEAMSSSGDLHTSGAGRVLSKVGSQSAQVKSLVSTHVPGDLHPLRESCNVQSEEFGRGLDWRYAGRSRRR